LSPAEGSSGDDAQSSQGIQQLLAAEKNAAEVIEKARRNKNARLKQAKDEAEAEIARFRDDQERKFKELESKVWRVASRCVTLSGCAGCSRGRRRPGRSWATRIS
jgi:UDP-N-acetylglucosamine:LPS N-acetylglucosamine transferase